MSVSVKALEAVQASEVCGSLGEGGSKWRSGERSEPLRNGDRPSPRLRELGVNASSAGRAALPERPDPEVLERPFRRRFTGEYKRRIVEEASTCRHPGELGALLRREGLYSSLLSKWRVQGEAALGAGFAPRKRGRKPGQNSERARVARLERENARLRRNLEEAKLIIEIQKKTSQLLGIKLTDVSERERILYGEESE